MEQGEGGGEERKRTATVAPIGKSTRENPTETTIETENKPTKTNNEGGDMSEGKDRNKMTHGSIQDRQG